MRLRRLAVIAAVLVLAPPASAADAKRCPVATVRDAGPGRVLGVHAERASCRSARRLVAAYQRCLDRRRDRCYTRIRRRCVQPAFLGRCRTSDRFFERTLRRARCTERRTGLIRGRYDATVDCVRGRRRIVAPLHAVLPARRSPSTRERELRAAWANPRLRRIRVTRDIVLRSCRIGDPIRESSGLSCSTGAATHCGRDASRSGCCARTAPGSSSCSNVTLTRGGSDGPGGAVTTRGEIRVVDSKVQQNLSEEPGGGIMSQRRATIVRSIITGNLANDDGGGVYARRGGIQVYDSIVSGNLVDGSGGGLGSTGDILVVRSHMDGNTTDGDGGAIYTDEDGDVTVIDSTVSGSTADGPGGAFFTLDGDVTVVGSTLSGNRADDRGGAIAGEAAVTIVNSTLSRNLAVAHVGGGAWAARVTRSPPRSTATRRRRRRSATTS